MTRYLIFIDALFISTSFSKIISGIEDISNLILLIIGVLSGLASLYFKFRKKKTGSNEKECAECPFYARFKADFDKMAENAVTR